MFQKNDMVRYGAHGVCKIEDITEKSFNGAAIQYYVLRLVYNDTSTIYGPLHNQTLTQNMRKVLSEEDLRPLIQTMPQEESLWIKNEEMRKARYQEILAGGNRADLIRMPKALYLHQREQQEKGRRLHVGRPFFKEAEKMLHEEFTLVLGIPREQDLPYNLEQLQGGAEKLWINAHMRLFHASEGHSSDGLFFCLPARGVLRRFAAV